MDCTPHLWTASGTEHGRPFLACPCGARWFPALGERLTVRMQVWRELRQVYGPLEVWWAWHYLDPARLPGQPAHF